MFSVYLNFKLASNPGLSVYHFNLWYRNQGFITTYSQLPIKWERLNQEKIFFPTINSVYFNHSTQYESALLLLIINLCIIINWKVEVL